MVRTCASKFPEMSLPCSSCVAVWPASQIVLPPCGDDGRRIGPLLLLLALAHVFGHAFSPMLWPVRRWPQSSWLCGSYDHALGYLLQLICNSNNRRTVHFTRGWRHAFCLSSDDGRSGGGPAGSAAGYAAGNLAGQQPIEVTVDLGKPGQHAFMPNNIKFETGKLYKLILRNPSDDPHYFTSHGIFAAHLHAQGSGRADARRQAHHARGIQGRDPRDRGLSRAQRGMVVRAGGDRPRHRPALRHRQGRQDATPTSAWWARSSSSKPPQAGPTRKCPGATISARRSAPSRHHDPRAAHAFALAPGRTAQPRATDAAARSHARPAGRAATRNRCRGWRSPCGRRSRAASATSRTCANTSVRSMRSGR